MMQNRQPVFMVNLDPSEANGWWMFFAGVVGGNWTSQLKLPGTCHGTRIQPVLYIYRNVDMSILWYYVTIYDLYHINILYIWVNYNISLTWIKAIWGWFPLLTMIPGRSQWGRYNLPRYLYTGFKKTSPTFRWSVLAQKKVLLRRAHVLLLPKISIVVGPEPRSWTPPEAGWDIWPTKNGDQNPTLGLHMAFGKWILMDVYSFTHSKPCKTIQDHSTLLNGWKSK